MATLFGDPERYAQGLTELAPGVHAWLQPNGAWGEANAGLIVGENASLLVDTLWDLPTTRRMLDAMRAHTADAPITTVVNTHGDGDHWFGNELAPTRDIITTQAALDHEMKVTPSATNAMKRLGKALAKGPGPLGPSGAFLAGMVGPYDHTNITPTLPTRTFSGRLELEVGGRKVELIEVGPAHTSGDSIVHVPDARVVFAADVAFIASTPVMWAGPLENWFKALDTIQALDPRVVVPGHGPLTDPNGLEEVRAYWTYMESAARRRRAQSPEAAAREIVTSDEYAFGDWECPERAVINIHTLRRTGKEPQGPAVVRILAAVGRLAAELPGRTPTALHP
jgi:glyoxylase-like metal-dependent hydrolase (beta-lactamase superfamily II)